MGPGEEWLRGNGVNRIELLLKKGEKRATRKNYRLWMFGGEGRR